MASSVDSDWQDIPAPQSSASSGDWQDIPAPSSQSDQGNYWKSATLGGPAVAPTTLGQKADYAARKGLQVVTDLPNALFELPGEAVRTAVGGLPFRLPSVVRDVGITANNPYVTTQQPPTNMFSLPRKIIQGTAVGLTQGPKAGINEFNRSIETPIEGLTDLGTAVGTTAMAPKIAQAPFEAAQNAVSPILSGVKAGGKKLFSSISGVSEPAISARMTNPAAVQNAVPNSDIAQRLAQTANTLQNQISDADKVAWGTLSKSYTPPQLGYTPEDRAIPKDTVADILKSAKDNLKVYGGGLVGKASKQAASTIDSLMEDIGDVGQYVGGKVKSLLGVPSSINKNNFLPETTVKGIIQSLDENINWGDDTAAPLNSALESARTKLDTLLKKQNPAYGEAMEPVAAKMNLVKNIQRQFNIKSVPGQGYVPGTATESNIANVLNNNKSATQNTLAQIADHTGEDYLGMIRNAKYSKEFQPGMRAQGSRRTLLGTALGTGIGHLTGSPTLGAMAGGTTGFMLDTQGGPIAARVIDAISGIPGIDNKTIQAIKTVLPSVLSEQEGEAASQNQQQNSTPKKPNFDVIYPSSPKPKPLFRKAS